MADNIAVTEGAGKDVATDDVGGKQYQRIKLDLGTDGAAAPALAGAGAVATGVQRITLASDDPAVAKLGTIDTDTGVIAGDTTSIDGKITACNTGAVVLSSGTVTTVSTVSAVTSLDKSVYVDDADWTDNTSSHTLVGGIYQSSPHTVTDGDVSPFGVDVNGNIVLGTGAKAIGKLAANSGIDIGDVDVTSVVAGVGATNLGKARDSALGATDTGVMALAVRDDTLTTLTPADGDYVPLRVGSTGKLHVTDANITACNTGAVVISSGTVTTVSTVTNLSQLGGTAITMDEGVHDAGCQRITIATDDDSVLSLGIIDDWDATHASAASADGPQVMGAGYSAGLPTDVGTDGDAARICTDRYGRIVRGIMPQNFVAIFDSADASAEANVVKAATASRKIYILSLTISVDAEMWVKLQDEDSNAITCKHWFKAGGGKTITYSPEAPLVLDVVNKALEVITEGAGNIGVEVTGYLAV